jgi:O-antigen/teichoic acid export membrane protein
MAQTEPTTVSTARGSQALVLKNAVLLVGAQAASMPISLVLNAAMARYLGVEEFGLLYLAATFVGFGFLLVEWGQSGTLPAHVARDRSRAGEFLGSGLAWRAVAAPVAYGLIAVGCHALGYPARFQVVLALQALAVAIGALASPCQDTVRGFERTDIAAISMVAQQLLSLALVLPVLALGGRLAGALVAFAVVNAVLVFVSRALRRVGVGRLEVKADTARMLVAEGWPFLLFGLTLALQPNIDAIFLSKLAPPEVVGWHAAARKLLGVLVFPAAALISALYPTLCRLYTEDEKGYRDTANGALRTSALVVGPMALGAALFADDAIRIFSKEAFGPAADNLRYFAPFLFLVYFSMPLGSSLLAAGRQRAWAGVQLLCVLVSLVLDPLLVPWFQHRTGNGGLGVCVATLVSESLVVGGGLWLTPRGVVDRRLMRSIGLTLAAGAVMAGVAVLLRGATALVAAPASMLAYFATLWAMGGLEEQQIGMLKAIIDRKLGRG